MGGLQFSAIVHILHNIQKDLLRYISLVSHLVVVAAQCDEVIDIKSLVIVLIDSNYMVYFHRLIIQPSNGVV